VIIQLFSIPTTIKDARKDIEVLELYALKGNRDNVPAMVVVLLLMQKIHLIN
jgi:hypothetical protein